MSTMVNIVRYHLVDKLQYVIMPWAVVLFSFLVNVVVVGVASSGSGDRYSGGIAAIYAIQFVLGVLSMTRTLPFGLFLGLSRRTYYLGTALTIGAMGVGYGLVLTGLKVVEEATGGWGMQEHFFRVPWLFDSPWYLYWLTSFVLLVLWFLMGMWYGLVYRRWNVVGLAVFGGAQALVLLAVVILLSLTGSWPAVWNFFGTVTAIGFTGVLAAVAVLLGLGGLVTIRRVTV